MARLAEFSRLGDEAARERFDPTTARPWTVARAQPLSEQVVRLVAYRPFDRRWLYNNRNFIDRPRPELQRVWGNNNNAYMLCQAARVRVLRSGATACYPIITLFAGVTAGMPSRSMIADRRSTLQTFRPSCFTA